MSAVKAIYVSSRYKTVLICMNEWNRIPIGWFSDASPKPQGAGSSCVPLHGLSRMCTYSRAVEWFELQIMVDIHLDLRPIY